MRPSPIIIPAHSWSFVLFGAFPAAPAAWLGTAIVADPGLLSPARESFWICGGVMALLLAGVALATLYALNPPELWMAEEGVVLRTPLRDRLWSWGQIGEIRVTGGRGARLEFDYYWMGANGKDKLRCQPLGFNFTLNDYRIRDMMLAARKAAEANVDSESFLRAIELAKAGFSIGDAS